MVKSNISTILVAIFLALGMIFEGIYIKNQFGELSSSFNVLYQKVEQEVAKEDDVLAVQKNWINKKNHLHIFIPHGDIKEIDLWLSEAVTLVRDKEWKDAISKIEVLKELAEQIPSSFYLKLGNIL